MNHENKDQSGEMRPESEGERQVKIIPISNEVPAEITFIEINGEMWVKRKDAIASYRAELKKKIEGRIRAANGMNDFAKKQGDYVGHFKWHGILLELNGVIKLIDQTTEI